MRIKHMFKKTVRDIRGEEQENIPEVPDNLMRKCNVCKAAVFVDEVKQNQYICPHCGNYFHVPAYRRIKMIADRKSFVEWDAHMEEQNPLQYRGYEEKLQGLREKTGLDEAVVTGKCTIKGTSVALGVCDCRFMMSSMGEVVGEKITRVFERATEEKLPVILYICSGGARMQEGLVSLCDDPHRPDNRRRDGKLCYAGRYYPGRAESADRFCRSQSDRTDHRAKASQRLPESGISSGTRLCGQDRKA